MEIRYFKNYSHCLGRDMEMKVYGHRGKPVLFIPCQAGRFMDFEGFHMDDVFRPWIDAGKVMVFSIDTIDGETWANKGGDNRWRIERHEAWFHYIVDELVPQIHHLAGERNWHQEMIMTFGCSMGAQHAANLIFRRPDLFDSCLALSGVYDSRDAFGGYMDDLVYANSPCDYIAGMPADHPYISLYNQRKIIICVGQGAWEDVLKESTAWLGRVLYQKGINASVNFWGYDVNHDWPWWYKQTAYYLPMIVGNP
ncbi:MAG: alpha/beta hydrolase-fold protein [Clostridiales bacterium]|nr:alpha/beta hydrolase-fold protein [Clostridiales bacterium]MDY3763173.1 alpha/beta hydrolase-fold protein [Candidatus Ventricola sp.]MCI6587605.1 alpha/beta hydrolase-fold protein [Clostridiales bacterium]MCI7703985.1 alpha/beta hydrolase-fold protein [Clostridiales bacterium]MDY3832393.1 alpha/beta hydrolase-fold protein [Candidatus Ventricola sp.]